MSDETSIEDKTAAVVAERRKRGPNKPKHEPMPAHEAATEPSPVVAHEPTAAVSAPHAAPGRRLFPVVLERNYHPEKDFLINGKEPSAEERVKVYAGTAIEMDLEEARTIIPKGIARRNDPIG